MERLRSLHWWRSRGAATRRISSSAGSSSVPSILWTGEEFAIAWGDSRGGNLEIYLARVSEEGTKIGAEVAVTTSASDSYAPALAWTGTEFGVSWHDYRDSHLEIYFARLDVAGAKIGDDVRVSTDDGFDSAATRIVWTGTEFVVAWSDRRHGGYEVFLARLDVTGARIGDEIRLTNDIASSYAPSLVWTGTELGLAWQDERDGNYEVYFTRLDPSGAPLGPALRVSAEGTSSANPSLVWTPSGYAVSFHDERRDDTEVFFARVGGCW